MSGAILHIIPVPVGWSPEQSWEHLQRGLLIPDELTHDVGWAVVEVDDDEHFLRLHNVDEAS